MTDLTDAEIAELERALKNRSFIDPAHLTAAFSSALSEIRRRRAEEGWRPVKTAPSDGRKALVYRPLAGESNDPVVSIKRMIGGNNHCWPDTVPAGQKPTNPTDGSCHVTHWRPLPPPPSNREG